MQIEATQVKITEFGSPDVLIKSASSWQSEEPQVAVYYASINPIDLKTRAGIGWAAKENADKLPWCPGYDVAGELLDAEGRGSGQYVCGLIGFPFQGGGYANIVTTDLENLVTIPEGVELRQAAALPLAGLTAYQALSRFGELRTGEQVVVLGAGGGVGHLVVQLAVKMGVEVTSISRSENHAWLSALGATHCIDYQQPDWQVRAAAEASLVIDCVGGDVGLSLIAELPCGTDVVTLPTVTADAMIEAGDKRGCHVTGMLVQQDTKVLKQLVDQLAEGKLKVHIDAEFELEKAADAHRMLEQGGVKGKVVLTVPENLKHS
ncbi:NADP-dependent oxidoreductase [Corallincola platygyrae]|uniref:NADP-dependent oxidoreductase n=1 Tax=Corallincola platygyrae TaxID=1193278 RepID=A0ABW4XM50_9GAMM